MQWRHKLAVTILIHLGKASVHCYQSGTRLAPILQNVVVDGLCHCRQKSQLSWFLLKVTSSFDYQTTCTYTGLCDPVKVKYSFTLLRRKKKHLKIAYLLSTEGYKNTNQCFQEKYKKKATSKVLQKIKTSFPLKRFGKCSCFSTGWIEQILQQNLPMSFHVACGQKHISHYLWKR